MLDFGNPDQLFAYLGVVGLTISFIKLNSTRTFKVLLLDIICFILLASPLVRRMTAVPIELRGSKHYQQKGDVDTKVTK